MLRMISGFRVSRAIYVAAELGIADLLKDGPKSSEELARLTSTHPPSLYRVIRALASVGVFAEDEQGHFTLTPIAGTLRSDVPGSLRAWAILVLGEEDYQAWGDLIDTVRTGETAFNHVFGIGIFQYEAQQSKSLSMSGWARAHRDGA